jgi:solute carrier family 25 carnitine/acylcarnitine transporter 20/29
MDHEFIYGSLAGLTGQGLCHPLDTIKNRYQSQAGYNLLKDIKSNGVLTVYKGLPSPLASVILEKAVLFYGYDQIKRRYNLDPFSAGIGAGLITTFTVTPFERIKILAQTSQMNTAQAIRQAIRKDGPVSLYRGWTATLFREVPGYGIYFWAYEQSKKIWPTYNPLTSFLTGSITGVSSWIVIYPSDPVKTIMQKYNAPVKAAMREVAQQSQEIYGNRWRGFYRGFGWGIGRAAILHGLVILGYETSKHLLEQSN